MMQLVCDLPIADLLFLQVTGALNMFVRMTSDMETYIVSVERINEYVDCPKEVSYSCAPKVYNAFEIGWFIVIL